MLSNIAQNVFLEPDDVRVASVFVDHNIDGPFAVLILIVPQNKHLILAYHDYRRF